MPSAKLQPQSKNVDDQAWRLSFSLHTHRRARTNCCPYGPHRFTTVAGQGWLAGLAEPALDAETTLARRRAGRQGGIGSLDRDGLFEQETGAKEHDRSSSLPPWRAAIHSLGRNLGRGS